MVALRTAPVASAAPVTSTVGGRRSPAAALIAAPAEVHPALALLYDLREQERALGGPLPIDTLIEQAPAIEAALEAARADRDAHSHVIRTLQAAPPVVSRTVPEGF